MTKVSSWTAELFSLLIMRDVLWVPIMHFGVTGFNGLGMQQVIMNCSSSVQS